MISLTATALHHTHASAETHSTATTTTTASSATAATDTTLESALGQSLVLLAGRVTDSLINGKNGACGLTCSREHVQAHDLRLPNELIKHIVDCAF